MEAGLAQLAILEQQDVYRHINLMGEKLARGLSNIARNAGITACVNQIGSLVCIFWGIEKAEDYQ
jgi:glutamate-1-semialdehyde 2,1-aminomutase